MDASQYKDYILTLLFVKYVSDKQKADPHSLITVPQGGSFDDMLALKGRPNIGEEIDKIIGKLAEANGLVNVIDLASFNDEEKLGRGKEMVDWLTKLVTIFADLDFRGSRADHTAMGHTDHAGHKSMTPDAAAHANHAGMDHGSVPHTATGDPEQNPVAASHPEYIALSDGAAPWGSDLLQPSDSYSYIFDVPGEYKYICIRHVMSGMRGTIVVEE